MNSKMNGVFRDSNHYSLNSLFKLNLLHPVCRSRNFIMHDVNTSLKQLMSPETWSNMHGEKTTKKDAFLNIPGLSPTCFTQGGLAYFRYHCKIL